MLNARTEIKARSLDVVKSNIQGEWIKQRYHLVIWVKKLSGKAIRLTLGFFLFLIHVMTFPAEIVHHILDELVSEYDALDALNDHDERRPRRLWKAILLSSRVSHSLRDYLLPQIFREVRCATQERVRGLHSIITSNLKLPSYIKTFHFFQSPPSLGDPAWLEDMEWTPTSEHWVFLEPLLAPVLQLLPNLEVLILEVFQPVGDGTWSRWPESMRQSIENIIRGGRLKIAPCS